MTFSKFYHFILWSVGNMMFMSTLLTIFYLASIYGVELPNPKFVTDVVTKFNRFGIIYHLPSMKLSQVHEYNKLIPQFMWVFFSMNGLIIVIKSCNLDKFVNTRAVQGGSSKSFSTLHYLENSSSAPYFLWETFILGTV